MFEWDALRGITLRALRIDYIAGAVCELAVISSGSGSGSGESSALDITPVERRAGPTNLIVSVSETGVVTLTWSEQSYIYSYVIYEGSSADGPFTQVTANVLGDTFSYSPGPGQYFYKATGVEEIFGETFPSNIVGPITVT